MSEVFRCEDKDTLVAYLYGEVDSDMRREVERHLRTCAACTHETEGLQEARQDLQLWMPPEPALGFSITQKSSPAAPAPVLTSPRWAALHSLPVWAQVAAAALLVAASAAIANVEVRSTTDGLVVTTGWMQKSNPTAAMPDLQASKEEWRRELVALEQNLRAEITARQEAIRTAVTIPPVEPGGRFDTAAVFQRVQSMIAASEDRQQQEMARRFIQAERTWNMRWTNDRQAMSRHLGNLQGRTMAVQAGQQEMMNQFRLQRVSSPQPHQ
jgi:anti-sigma factor RsiW